jgi:Zn-dependent protease with chaperone function
MADGTATNFFERQDAAHRKTGLLVAYFSLCVAAIIVGIYFSTLAIFFYADTKQVLEREPGASIGWWNAELFLGVCAGTLVVIALGSLYKTATLRKGGTAVATLLGGRQIAPETQVLHERRLMNIVEEMAIASGIPVPPVFVLEHEQGINAFAAGWTPGDAVVAVTRGTLELLDRDELQGVVAHEFSHILNSDMRLNIRLMGIVHGILVVALIGYVLLRTAGARRVYFSSRRNNNGAPLLVLGLALVIIGYAGVFFGRLIKSAVSREREFLADASAVQFTRNPEGIAGALKKIGGLMYGSGIENTHAEEASHLFFGNVVSSWFSLLSTHPPLKERIKRLDPAFDGHFTAVKPGRLAAAEPASDRPKRAALRPGTVDGAFGRVGEPLRAPLEPLEAVLQIGAPGIEHLAFAALLLEELPDRLHQAAQNPFGARAVIFALLLDDEEAVRTRQLERLAEHADRAVYEETRKLSGLVAAVRPESRLPLVDLTFPALRTLSEEQYRSFRENVVQLVRADKKIQLFEYVLHHMLVRHLDEQFSMAKRPRTRYYSIKPMLDECAAILSLLAHLGHKNPQDAKAAFEKGAEHLKTNGANVQLIPREECGLKEVDRALEKLRETAPGIKKRVLAACVASIATDGKVTVGEGELLRGIADSLDCPMPPFLPGQELHATE